MIITSKDLHLLNFKGLRVGLTSGCFDLIHYYHLRYLERCKALCDILIVGVDSDLLIHQNKNKYPEIPEHHRISMINSLKCVDIAFQMNSLKDFNDMLPIANVVFKNSTTIYGHDVVLPDNVEFVVVPDIEEVQSTTALVQKIKSQQQ